MITHHYIDMCSKNKLIQDIFIQDGMVSKVFIPSFVWDGKSIQLLLHHPTKDDYTLHFVDRKDAGVLSPAKLEDLVWLPTQEQIQTMYIDYCTKVKRMLDFNPLVMSNAFTEWINRLVVDHAKNHNFILYISKCNINQLYLMFIMYEIFEMIWDATNDNWITIESLDNIVKDIKKNKKDLH